MVKSLMVSILGTLTLSIRGELFLLVPLKLRLWGRRHEFVSPNLGGRLPPHPCYNLPLKLTEMGCGSQWKLDPLQRISPKRSQYLTSPQMKPTASDRPSPLLKGNF
ncbi:hypothetical protein AVEN_161915-1 [Araneus ventricosus]|uniref:Uncharacterized protein n=1 Tax=Araneus ventricosus TaxID=182803 RepID=A0A4Y2VIA7_ARAVE|nr:hypothetical protein AVEN_161915-1 [Araneus ventricosus]